MVECVEELASKLQVEALGDGKDSMRTEVEVHRARANQRVPPRIAKGIGSRHAETACIKPLFDPCRLWPARVFRIAGDLCLIVAVFRQTERCVVARCDV